MAKKSAQRINELIKRIGRDKIVTLLSIFVLIFGLGAGVVLVQRQQEIREKAAIAEPCKICQGSVCVTQAVPPYCSPTFNECNVNSDCAPANTPTPGTCPQAGQCQGNNQCYRYETDPFGGCRLAWDTSCCVTPTPEPCEQAGQCQGSGQCYRYEADPFGGCRLVYDETCCPAPGDLCRQITYGANCVLNSWTCNISYGQQDCNPGYKCGVSCTSVTFTPTITPTTTPECSVNEDCLGPGGVPGYQRRCIGGQCQVAVYCDSECCDVGSDYDACYVNHYVTDDPNNPVITDKLVKVAVRRSCLGYQQCGAEQIDVTCDGTPHTDSTWRRYQNYCQPPVTATNTPAPTPGRQDLCESSSISSGTIQQGGSLTMTITSKVAVKKFMLAFYNLDNLYGPGNPKPIYFEANTHYVVIKESASARRSMSFTINHGDIDRPDLNNGGQIPKNIQINGYFFDENDMVSLPNPNCVESFNVATPTNTPTSTKTPTPTATNTPTPTPPPILACLNIRVFDTRWNELTPSELSQLGLGDKVRFTVAGFATEGTLDKARFRINSASWRTPVTQKRPGTDEFYDEYTIPSGTYSFRVNAQVHHLETDSWI